MELGQRVELGQSGTGARRHGTEIRKHGTGTRNHAACLLPDEESKNVRIFMDLLNPIIVLREGRGREEQREGESNGQIDQWREKEGRERGR